MARSRLDSRLLGALLLARNGVDKHEACAMRGVCETEFSDAQRAFETLPRSVVSYLARLREETDRLRRHIASHSKRLQMQVSQPNN